MLVVKDSGSRGRGAAKRGQSEGRDGVEAPPCHSATAYRYVIH